MYLKNGKRTTNGNVNLDEIRDFVKIRLVKGNIVFRVMKFSFGFRKIKRSKNVYVQYSLKTACWIMSDNIFWLVNIQVV